jgi:integrase
MGKVLPGLSAVGVSKAKKPGLYADGGGLYLQVTESRAQKGKVVKSWLFRFKLNGHARAMGLGSGTTFTLAEARERARECRKLLDAKIDPIEARNELDQLKLLEISKGMTFAECAAAYIKAHRSGWRNAKHVSQWENTLATYAEPVLGPLPVQSIDTALVMKVLEPIWHEKTETASRLRGRIESILGWATVRGYRAGDNPARWRGHLDNLLPTRSKIQKVEHHAALPYSEMSDFMAKLRAQAGIAALALEFTILTAARTGESIGAKWKEFDVDAKLWTVPADRMKARKEHRIPLSPRALKLIEELRKVRTGECVFPGRQAGKSMSNMAMLMLLKRMERADLTAHGFRSTFRDWAAECTSFPREVAEAALAHTLGDKVEAAYRRGDLFEKRRLLMQAWAKHCQHVEQGKVLPMARRRKA